MSIDNYTGGVCMELYSITYKPDGTFNKDDLITHRSMVRKERESPLIIDYFILLRDESYFYKIVGDDKGFMDYCKYLGLVGGKRDHEVDDISSPLNFFRGSPNNKVFSNDALGVNSIYLYVNRGRNIVSDLLKEKHHDMVMDIINVVNCNSSVASLLLHNHPITNYLINNIDKMLVNELNDISCANITGIPYKEIILL